MSKKKTTKIAWDESGKNELKKFIDFISHCQDFAESIAVRKERSAVNAEDVADAIQEYAKLWAGMTSKKKPANPKSRPKKEVPEPPILDEATEKRIIELKKFIREEAHEPSDSCFGDPKARIAHWKKEIEELQNPVAPPAEG